LKIYTKTGDAGETSLFDKSRVSKADARVDAYGEVDELNATLGAARAAGIDADLAGALETIQKELFAVGARLADPSKRIAGRVTKAAILESDVEATELAARRMNQAVRDWFEEDLAKSSGRGSQAGNVQVQSGR